VTRGAVQSAEDARLITLRKIRDEKIANERLAQQQRVDEARRRQEESAENARVAQSQATQAQADREAALKAQADAQSAAAQAQQERAAAEQARQEAIAQQQALATQTQQANLQAQQAQEAAARAEREKEETRTRLMTQLNQVLQTKDSARGLIVNMSDVLFDLNRATLKPGAQLRLAKVAGIIQAYPDLRLQIEGFTDSTGSADYNQKLSEKRAQTVREFLVGQGVNEANITAQGFGKENPVASNDTAAGRQMNRRVDLVVSGESIQSARSQGAATPVGGATGAATDVSPSATQNGNSMSSPVTSNPANTVPPPTTTQPNTPIQNTLQTAPNPAQPQTTTPQTNPQQQSLTPPPHGV